MFAEFIAQAQRLEKGQRRTFGLVALVAALECAQLAVLVYLVAR
jgi:hypothetical protein